MQKQDDNIFARGLTFFGRTNRLISHELKNVLAIISETTSLMDELIELSEEGRPLEPGRLRALAGSIMEDIDRANGIIRNMNTFAHGVDTFVADIDVGRTIKVMIGIARMHAAAKKTRLAFPDPGPCQVISIPFLLQNLLYESLTGILSGAGASDQIRIGVVNAQPGVRIRIQAAEPDFGQRFAREKGPFFEKHLAAAIRFDPDTKTLQIELPERIEEPDIT